MREEENKKKSAVAGVLADKTDGADDQIEQSISGIVMAFFLLFVCFQTANGMYILLQIHNWQSDCALFLALLFSRFVNCIVVLVVVVRKQKRHSNVCCCSHK